MSVNKYQPHVFVLPEDDANRQLANGFLREPSLLIRRIQVLPEAGGWTQVLDHFKSGHIMEMGRYPQRFMVLLIDLDGFAERLAGAKAEIPAELIDRVFILGALTTPEALKQAKLGSYEEIGAAMAKYCLEDTDRIWGHEIL
jgi:hypothetical protein